MPEAALLNANGLHARSEIHGGMKIVIPVYNAHAAKVAKADDDEEKAKPRHVAKRDADDDSDDNDHKADRADAGHKKHKLEAKKADDEQADDDRTEKKAKAEKTAKAEKSEKTEKSAKADKPEKVEKSGKSRRPRSPPNPTSRRSRKVGQGRQSREDRRRRQARVARQGRRQAGEAAKSAPEVAKAEPAKPQEARHRQSPDRQRRDGDADAAKAAENGQFRWPARGRIIQGFKSGGNDGINIAVPEGTSVRAAEDGKVAYAGSELKGYGNLVLIRHSNGFVSAYANNGELDVKQRRHGQARAGDRQVRADRRRRRRRNCTSNCARARRRSIRPTISPASDRSPAGAAARRSRRRAGGCETSLYGGDDQARGGSQERPAPFAFASSRSVGRLDPLEVHGVEAV